MVVVDDDLDPIQELIQMCIEIVNPQLPDEIINTYGSQAYLQFLERNFTDQSPIDTWGYSYAQRLYALNGINQIDHIISKLIENPFCKSATISLVRREQDDFHTPCLTSLDFKIRDEALIVTATYRSQDIGKKMYGDAIEVLKIAHMMMLRLKVKRIILFHSISSAHVYIGDLEMLRTLTIPIKTL